MCLSQLADKYLHSRIISLCSYTDKSLMYHLDVQKYLASDGLEYSRLYPIVTGHVIWVRSRYTHLMNPQWQSMLPAPTNLHLLEAVFYGQVIHPVTATKAQSGSRNLSQLFF
jgi:hypothetical protein